MLAMPWNADHDAPLTDPRTPCDADGVEFRELTHQVDPAELEATPDPDSHVAVGVTGDRGVLLMDDGDHGWTLPAFAVEPGDDYLAVARREFEALTGVAAAVESVERVRRHRYHPADATDADGAPGSADAATGADDAVTVWNVVVRATPADPDALAAPESRETGTDLAWFDGVPDGVEGPVADDVDCIAD